MDKIIIEDLEVLCTIGYNEWEQNQKQRLVLNLTVFADLDKVSKSDRLEDTVDYFKLSTQILELVENNRRLSLEALAGDLAELCLTDPLVQQVIVRLDKPGAISQASSAGIEIIRHRNKNLDH
jgi:FolB domain-containing protein